MMEHRKKHFENRIAHAESRIERNGKKIFAIHGGGNIGLGLMADIVSRSPHAYQIIATSNNELNRTIINSINKVYLQHGRSAESNITCIKNISMVSRNKSDVIELYSKASLVALCLTQGAVTAVAKDIAEALINRYEIDKSGLKILVLMNLPQCDQFVQTTITKEMIDITNNHEYVQKILQQIVFVPTVIDRIVTPIPESNIKAQISLGLIKKGFSNHQVLEILSNHSKLSQAIKKHDIEVNLFNAEQRFSMYTVDTFSEGYQFSEIKKVKDLNQLEEIKNKYINGPHAILAWIGGLLGCRTIGEAIQHPTIYAYIREMIDLEIAPILQAEFPDILKEEFEQLASLFFERCSASVDDPIIRVGRDPLRKLDSGGRIRGTIELAQKNHLQIATPRLEQGIAIGYLYAIKGIDPENASCQKINEIYKENHRSFKAALCFSGDTAHGNFTGFHPYKDRKIIDSILSKITNFDLWAKENHLYRLLSSNAALLSKSDLWFQQSKNQIKVSPLAANNVIFNHQEKFSSLRFK